MKMIGIKLADGTFYPVLQEDQPGEKTLELTTAHNDQTRVMVDLYRTKTGTMEEAEYVDTLRIDNLVKRPSGDPDISFVISIDGNNELSARIVDKETGAESETTIELINRTLEERLETDPTESEYAINDAAEETFSNEMLTEGLPEMEDTFAMDEPPAEETPIEEPTVTPTDEDIFGSSDDISDETPSTDSIITDDLPDFGDTFDMPDGTSSNDDIFADTTPSADDTFNSDDLDLPDFGDNTMGETSTSSDESFNTADLDLPDFGDDPFATDTSSNDPFANSSSDDIFGDTSSSDDIFGDSSADDDIFGESSSTPAAAPMGGGMFDGLYDTGEFDKPEKETKKTKAPVIICVICAIICIAAVLLIFFVIPSKINLLGKTGNSEIVEIAQVEKVEPAPAPIPEPEPEPEPVVPSAKEDEIVIIEEAEIVKPEPPAPPTPEPKPDIIYKVKWGDTLWDIADTYYKNPWRYIKIANYNGIKNPDYIISGTTILIPQE